MRLPRHTGTATETIHQFRTRLGCHFPSKSPRPISCARYRATTSRTHALAHVHFASHWTEQPTPRANRPQPRTTSAATLTRSEDFIRAIPITTNERRLCSDRDNFRRASGRHAVFRNRRAFTTPTQLVFAATSPHPHLSSKSAPFAPQHCDFQQSPRSRCARLSTLRHRTTHLASHSTGRTTQSTSPSRPPHPPLVGTHAFADTA